METQLATLENNWKDLCFQYMKYGDPTQEKLTPDQIKEITADNAAGKKETLPGLCPR